MDGIGRADVAVLDADGREGRSVVRALLRRGLRGRALVAGSTVEAARAAVPRDVPVVAVDPTAPETLVAALAGVGRLVATAWPTEGDGYAESAAGRAVARAAAGAGLAHAVFVSTAGADRHTGVAGVEAKRRVELAYTSLRESTGLEVTLLRPALLMEDLLTRVDGPDDGTVRVRLPVPASRRLPVVALADVGTAAAALVGREQSGTAETVELAGDAVAGPEIAEALAEVLGRPVRFESVSAGLLAGAERDRWAWSIRGAAATSYAGDAAATLVPDRHDLRSWLRARGPTVLAHDDPRR